MALIGNAIRWYLKGAYPFYIESKQILDRSLKERVAMAEVRFCVKDLITELGLFRAEEHYIYNLYAAQCFKLLSVWSAYGILAKEKVGYTYYYTTKATLIGEPFPLQDYERLYEYSLPQIIEQMNGFVYSLLPGDKFTKTGIFDFISIPYKLHPVTVLKVNKTIGTFLKELMKEGNVVLGGQINFRQAYKLRKRIIVNGQIINSQASDGDGYEQYIKSRKLLLSHLIALTERSEFNFSVNDVIDQLVLFKKEDAAIKFSYQRVCSLYLTTLVLYRRVKKIRANHTVFYSSFPVEEMQTVNHLLTKGALGYSEILAAALRGIDQKVYSAKEGVTFRFISIISEIDLLPTIENKSVFRFHAAIRSHMKKLLDLGYLRKKRGGDKNQLVYERTLLRNSNFLNEGQS